MIEQGPSQEDMNFTAPATGYQEKVVEQPEAGNEAENGIGKYFDRDQFWQSVTTQAIENKPFDSDEANQQIDLFSNISIRNDALIKEQLKIASQVLEEMSKRGSQDPNVTVFNEDLLNNDQLLWANRMHVITWARESVLNSIGMPDKAYHASGLDASEIDLGQINNFVLKSSQVGAMDPGVYMSPYIESMYIGGDQAQKKIDVPVIFEIQPDQDCHAYAVNHKQSFMPIEITSKYRDCGGFTNAQLINVEESDLPFVNRFNKEKPQFKQVLLISGGSVIRKEGSRES